VPDGRTLASGGNDPKVRLWDAAAGSERLALKGHPACVYALAFSADGRSLASGRGQRCLRLWGVAAGQSQVALSGHSVLAAGVAFAPGGGLLASAGGDVFASTIDGELLLWDLAGANEPVCRPVPGGDWALAFVPGGRTLAVGSGRHQVTLWDRAGNVAGTFPQRAGVRGEPLGVLKTVQRMPTSGVHAVKGDGMTPQPNFLADAWAQHQARNLPEARRLYRLDLQVDAGNADGWCLLGIVCRALGDSAEAEVCYREALRLRPDYPEALINLGNALIGMGRAAEAVPLYQRVLNLRSHDVSARNSLGAALRSLGRPEEALAHYREALRLNPAKGLSINSRYTLSCCCLMV
jgi:hypothetical protein